MQFCCDKVQPKHLKMVSRNAARLQQKAHLPLRSFSLFLSLSAVSGLRCAVQQKTGNS